MKKKIALALVFGLLLTACAGTETPTQTAQAEETTADGALTEPAVEEAPVEDTGEVAGVEEPAAETEVTVEDKEGETDEKEESDQSSDEQLEDIGDPVIEYVQLEDYLGKTREELTEEFKELEETENPNDNGLVDLRQMIRRDDVRTNLVFYLLDDAVVRAGVYSNDPENLYQVAGISPMTPVEEANSLLTADGYTYKGRVEKISSYTQMYDLYENDTSRILFSYTPDEQGMYSEDRGYSIAYMSEGYYSVAPDYPQYTSFAIPDSLSLQTVNEKTVLELTDYIGKPIETMMEDIPMYSTIPGSEKSDHYSTQKDYMNETGKVPSVDAYLIGYDGPICALNYHSQGAEYEFTVEGFSPKLYVGINNTPDELENYLKEKGYEYLGYYPNDNEYDKYNQLRVYRKDDIRIVLYAVRVRHNDPDSDLSLAGVQCWNDQCWFFQEIELIKD